MKKVSTITGVIILFIATVILVGGAFVFQYLALQGLEKLQANTIQPASTTETYTNTQYGFTITLPRSWKGYTVVNQTWQGNLIDNFDQKYNGPLVIIQNPSLKLEYRFLGIPIMVITPDVWKLISEEKIAVSAAPIGPGKIGENANYIFALPPRYIGFGDELSIEQINVVTEIVKTFKAF